MNRFQIHQYPYSSDNYGVLIHCDATNETAAVDAGDASALFSALEDTGWTLTHLLITHHHGDHTAGLSEVKAATGCKVIGPIERSTAIAGLDEKVDDGDRFEFGGEPGEVIFTPGHTTDMINFYFPNHGVVFTGDTLFTLGCGRIFEGTPSMMWESLSKLAKLPPNTVVYSSHEYTLANAKFALSVDPENTTLQKRAEEISKLRADGKPTVPTTIAEELATNPFLRAGDVSIRKRLGMESANDANVFAEIRKRKDNF